MRQSEATRLSRLIETVDMQEQKRHNSENMHEHEIDQPPIFLYNQLNSGKETTSVTGHVIVLAV